MYAAIDISNLLSGLSLTNWLLIGGGLLLFLHMQGIVDASKWPLIGPILTALNIKPKPPVPVPPAPPVNPPVTDGEQEQLLQVEIRCQKLMQSLLDLRHFASEQPTDSATAMLKSCDVISTGLEDWHKLHTK